VWRGRYDGPMRNRRHYDVELAARGASLAYRVDEGVPFCWMCNAKSGERAKEHTFALSLLAELGATSESFSPTHMSSIGSVVSARRQMPSKALLAGEVCKDCNAGWMSDLEMAARPLLVAGARGETDRELGRAEQLTLARWFFKTAIVLNCSQNYRLLLPWNVRHSAKTGLHPDVRVLVARRPFNPEDQVDFRQGFSGLTALVPTDKAQELAMALERIYAGWIGVADWWGLVIYAVPGGWPEPGVDFRQIWPYRREFDWADLPLCRDLDEAFLLQGEPTHLTNW
jgi:hypothetical protein